MRNSVITLSQAADGLGRIKRGIIKMIEKGDGAMKEVKGEAKKKETQGKEKTPETRKRPRMGRVIWITAIAILLAVGMMVISIWSAAQKGTPNFPTSPTIERHGNEKGSPNAPVVVIEYVDFQCPSCGYVARLIEPQVDKEYIATGKVRWIVRNYAFLGQESEWAAQAARCAQDQEKFWEYHDLLFKNQRGENIGTYSIENLKKFAASLSLDMKAFNECFDSGKYVKAVQDEGIEGRMKGVSSTPTFFINGLVYPGAPHTYEAFKGMLEDALRNAGVTGTENEPTG